MSHATLTPHRSAPPNDAATRPAPDAHGQTSTSVALVPVARRPQGTPPLSARMELVRGALVTVGVLLAALTVQIMLVSALQHGASQQRAFAEFRKALAEGTIDIGPLTDDGTPLPTGVPVARIEISRIGVDEIVSEGTDAETLFSGPGHRRDTMLPGQAGHSVIAGRRASYGGPFSAIGRLDPGDEIVVTTGQGEFTYSIIGVRREGDAIPPPPEPGGARLTVVTADGTKFIPDGVLRVDADLVDDAVIGERRVITAASLPAAERAMSSDGRSMWVLALWLQALLLASLAAVWCWRTWHPAKTWIACGPVLALFGLGAAGEINHLLPNLL